MSERWFDAPKLGAILMPRKVQPQWGRQGMVRLRGWGRTDRELRDLDATSGAVGHDRGLLHDDEQIQRLASHLNFSNISELPAHIRSWFDSIRGFYLKGQCQEARVPPRRERNAALVAVLRRIEPFLAAVKALTPRLNWALVDLPQTEDLTPSRVFVTLPDRLRSIAAMARAASRDCPEGPSGSEVLSSLLQIATSADELADTLLLLDFASQVDVLKKLPADNEYEMNALLDVEAVSIRVSTAVDAALQTGRCSPGPQPNRELKQAIFWLCDLFEQCTGRPVTHTPRDKTHYDGWPHSPAGRFVLDFMKMCDDRVTPQSISSLMAEVVKKKDE
jgi:hypothetical protein